MRAPGLSRGGPRRSSWPPSSSSGRRPLNIPNPMKKLIAHVLIIAAIAASGCASRDSRPLPPGVIREGSLANQKLMADAATAATDSLKAKGCVISPKGVPFNQYVVTMPTGVSGSRKWTERWVFLVGNKLWPFTIHFQEDGLGAAHFEIEGNVPDK